MRNQQLVVALLERAEGNESIGTAWTETAIFSADAPVKEVLAWAREVSAAHDGNIRGNLMIRHPDDQRGADQ